ncbi:hypothetical protein BDY17DRAFT_320218 [Neohortaea acidophila]|uniref:NAD(P)-binding domain-containing protein n=1 Tax=Neohortaea acidophila TaxID=245834 RepID=A0A6A6Q8J8_9PEZI|nr:uncharacterized protein BDY17DRAFT_320218 [Neohortaea acidophila]KAF2487697.1 hypothetical protein BDY17DRAFT_320218 [Neohortaea acidophila]
MAQSYAVLGATGNVGQSVLQSLMDNNREIHAYCRSRQKLKKLSPQIAKASNVKVFEGSLSDSALLADCLRGTRAAFLAVAATGNQPGCSIAQETAHKVISALEELKASHPNERLPKLVVLSSASTEHRLMYDSSNLFLNILYRAFSNIYDDLKAAEQYLRSKDALVSVTFIKPGALSVDSPKGHVISLDHAVTPCTFLDLGGGMLEVADDDTGRYDMKSVAINSNGKVAFPWQAPLLMIRGLIVHFLPFMYKFVG